MSRLTNNKFIFLISFQLFFTTIYAQKDTVQNYRDSLAIRTSSRLSITGNFSETKKEVIADSDKLNTVTKKNTPKEFPDLKKIKPEARPDSNQLIVKPNLNLKIDSSVTKRTLLKNLKSVFPAGTISLGYDYGFLPYTVNMPSPASAMKMEGQLTTDIFNIPVDVTFFYSTQKNLIGLNNYFRISYNADRYKNKLDHKLSGKLDAYKGSLGNLNAQKQGLLQKMAYADYLSNIQPDKWPVDPAKNKLILPGLTPDSSGIANLPEVDTTGLSKYIHPGSLPGDNKYASKADSIKEQAAVYKQRKDSVARAYEDYKDKYAALSDSIKKIELAIDELEALAHQNPESSVKSKYTNPLQNFMSGIKRLDVGLCYPDYSTFLANNIPVQGINFEYQKNKLFFGFTYGTTMSTLLQGNKNIDGFLQNIRNSYNYFDINNLSAGRKIMAMKFGAGEKSGDHFFVGFLVGKGANGYVPGGSAELTTRPVETNLVMEGDARKQLGKNTFLDVTIGKSSLQQENLNMATLQTAAREVFSNFRSYASLVKLKTSINATRSILTFSVRWVDPFFNSMGIGFIRSDNMRYELRLDQPLGKRVRYSATARYEEDNLLKLLNYKNTFYSVNNTVSFKIKRGLMLRVGYTPLVRNLNTESDRFQNKNTIVTGILTFAPKSRKVQKQFNLLYNYYYVNSDSAAINFQNIAYYHQISFKCGFKTGLNVSWFKNNLKDTVLNDVFLAVLDAGYQFKNGSEISIAGKAAYKPNNQLHPGFILRSAIKLSGALLWENQIEKFIIGDLFNGYDQENLKKFPYCFTTKLILNF